MCLTQAVQRSRLPFWVIDPYTMRGPNSVQRLTERNIRKMKNSISYLYRAVWSIILILSTVLGCGCITACSGGTEGLEEVKDPVGVFFEDMHLENADREYVQEDQLKNKIPFFLVGKIKLSNKRSNAQKIDVAITVTSVKEIQSSKVDETITLNREPLTLSDGSYAIRFKGECYVPGNSENIVQFRIKLWRTDEENSECTGDIKVDCATEGVTSNFLTPYTKYITINPAEAEVLETPVIAIDNDRLVWDSVDNAVKYNYTVLPEGNFSDGETSDTYLDTSWLAPGDYTVKFWAVGDGVSYSTSQFSSVSFKKLPQVNTTVSDGVLSWYPIEDCTEYEIISDGEILKRVNGTSIELSTVDISSGGSVKLSIRPVVEGKPYINSASTSPVVLRKLETPVLEITTKLKWEKIDGADYYEVYSSDGTLFKTVEENECKISGTIGEKFYIIAKSNTSTFIASDKSNIVESDIG